MTQTTLWFASFSGLFYIQFIFSSLEKIKWKLNSVLITAHLASSPVWQLTMIVRLGFTRLLNRGLYYSMLWRTKTPKRNELKNNKSWMVQCSVHSVFCLGNNSNWTFTTKKKNDSAAAWTVNEAAQSSEQKY